MAKIRQEVKYGYSDITLIPKPFTTINSRKECNPFCDHQNHLPIFTAPMSQIVDEHNYKFFDNNGVIPILPRNIDFDIRVKKLNHGCWTAFGLGELSVLTVYFEKHIKRNNSIRLCVDLANGHMKKLLQSCELFKMKCKENNVICEIMTGNIANPDWVKEMNRRYTKENTPIDYVRCNIGSGSCCITASNTKIYFPSASLIKECVDANFNDTLKIIADGGIKNYSDVICAIGLGADYVMIGGLFAKCFESCGYIAVSHGKVPSIDSDDEEKKNFIKNYEPYREFYGMATKKAQIEFGGDGHKTAEGKLEVIRVKYTLRGWIRNMVDYFRSAMSYTDSRNLREFRENAEFVINSQGAINSVNK